MILGLILAFLLLISFLFSGMEAGLLSLNRVRLRHLAKHRNRAALRLQKLLKDPGRLLITVVLVTHLANILAIVLVTGSLTRAWGRAGYFLSLALFLPLYLFVLELLPKSLFRRFPNQALALLSKPLKLASFVLAPLLRLGSGLLHRLCPFLETEPRKLFAAREDFKYFTLESERTGAITPVERQLIHGVLDFRSIPARDLMIPLENLPSIDPYAEVEDLVAASRSGKGERFLVISETGEVLGLVHLFDILLNRSTRSRILSHLRRIAPVTADESAFLVMRRLRTARTPAALVMDGDQPRGIIFAETLYRRLISGPGGVEKN
jgi:CBS domain containing-hemolysin-like protein